MSDVRICFLSHQRALQETMDEIEYQQAVVARAARLTKNKPLCSDTEAETKTAQT